MPAAPPFHGFLRVPLLSLAQPPVTMSIRTADGANWLGDSRQCHVGVGQAILRSGTALGLLVIATAQASAGGFGIREQSAYGQGTSFAGIAAGGALSSMFWNPATMTQVPGIQSETDVAGHPPLCGAHSGTRQRASQRSAARQTLPRRRSFPRAICPISSVRTSGSGMSINAPFGLSVNFPDRWAGRDFGAGPTNLHTYNATPSIAYRINDWISVGAGVQIQYATEVVTLGLGPDTGPASRHQGQWLGLRLHRWRHFDTNADDDDRHWLALIHRSENRLHVEHELPCCP